MEKPKKCMLHYNPELVLELNHTCLLLMPLLLSLVIWLTEKLFVLRKKSTFNFFTVFQDSAQLVHTIGYLKLIWQYGAPLAPYIPWLLLHFSQYQVSFVAYTLQT